MANSKGAEERNRRELCEVLERAKVNHKLVKVCTSINSDTESYILLGDFNEVLVSLNVDTGNWLDSKAGQNKSNKRGYRSIELMNGKGYMCPNYTFKVICDGLFAEEDTESYERYKKYRDGIKNGLNEVVRADINHINGDTEDNSYSNLEIVSKGMNNVHSRFMSEVGYYYPSLIKTEYDCQGNAMHSWIDGLGVSCSQILEWNREHEVKIKAFKDKNGEFTSHLKYEEVTEMLEFFGKIEILSEVV